MGIVADRSFNIRTVFAWAINDQFDVEVNGRSSFALVCQYEKACYAMQKTTRNRERVLWQFSINFLRFT